MPQAKLAVARVCTEAVAVKGRPRASSQVFCSRGEIPDIFCPTPALPHLTPPKPYDVCVCVCVFSRVPFLVFCDGFKGIQKTTNFAGPLF